jgi:PA domain
VNFDRFVRVSCVQFVFLALILGQATASGDPVNDAMATIRPEAIRANMRFLADDLLEGRGTASRGYRIAATFMATQFESLGLQPAGDAGTYFQEVPLRSMRPDETKTTLTLVRAGKEETLTFREDFIAGGDPMRPERSVEAPVVFVGFGVTAPDQNYDDYKNIDAKGKIVALMAGAPNFASSLKAHYSSSLEKVRTAVAHGAVGMIALDDPQMEGMYSFGEQVRDLGIPEFRWLDKQGQAGNYFPELKGSAFLNIAATKKFFEGSPHTAEEMFAAVKAGKPMSFDMPITAKIRNVTKMEDAHSPNVAFSDGSLPSSLANDMQQPGLDFEAAAQFARFAFLTGYFITEDKQRPTWNKGDFFGEHYGGKN